MAFLQLFYATDNKLTRKEPDKAKLAVPITFTYKHPGCDQMGQMPLQCFTTSKMDTEEDQHDAKFNASAEKTYVDSKSTNYQPRKSRTRLIIIGVVAAAVILAVVIVVVVVVTQKKTDDDTDKENECGPFKLPGGLNFTDLSPTILSRIYTCPLKGDCWTGKQCFECFKLETWKVGNINNIPVCCPDCVISGLRISNSECKCRYNG